MELLEPIVALSSPPGMGAIALIRLSGKGVIDLASSVFGPHGPMKELSEAPGYSMVFGKIRDGEEIIDEVMIGVFRGPKSYTGEDVVEISCHGSTYIQGRLIDLFLDRGARMADPGEFTLRAFRNGKMDLSQAEAVSDLISSESAAAHQVAMQQMRGGFSSELASLREELIHFASMIELELDFAEEEVEFANRNQLQELIDRIKSVLVKLVDSFALGNVIKNGIPIAIAGAPNAGKSTLLNALLNEERAIVSEVAGTTRDTIEDEIVLGGISFRFIDTAGIRETEDLVESIGIKRTFEKIDQARAVIYLFDAAREHQEVHQELNTIQERIGNKELLVLANKVDLADEQALKDEFTNRPHFFPISALNRTGIDALQDHLIGLVNTGALISGDTVVTNRRHHRALVSALESIHRAEGAMHQGLSGDLMAQDIRQALFHLGEITGEITTDDLLGNIFSKFCIGK